MSYNIDNFKIKEIENFRIPIKEFDKIVFRKDFDFDTNEIKIESDYCEECEFEGIVKDGIIELSKMTICGEGSGHFMATIGEALLEKSTGKLVARLIWEEGDSVENLMVENGIIDREKI